MAADALLLISQEGKARGRYASDGTHQWRGSPGAEGIDGMKMWVDNIPPPVGVASSLRGRLQAAARAVRYGCIPIHVHSHNLPAEARGYLMFLQRGTSKGTRYQQGWGRGGWNRGTSRLGALHEGKATDLVGTVLQTFLFSFLSLVFSFCDRCFPWQ